MSTGRSTVRFGPFELDGAAAQLRREGVAVNLTGQPYRMLELLVERAGELVTREEIRARLWPDGHHADFESAINVAARRIREVLGDSADAPVYLTTVRGRGYRFDLPPDPTRLPLPNPLPAPFRRSRDRRWLGWVAAALVVIGGAVVLKSLTAPGEAGGLRQATRSGTVWRAAISPDGSRLAYVEQDGDESILKLCELGGSGECRRIVGPAGDVLKVLFSPDGQTIYFSAIEGPAPGRNIFRVSVAGGSPTPVVRGQDWLQDVTPDGRELLYLRNTEKADILHAVDVLTGSASRPIASRQRPDRLTAAAISPDGSMVAGWWLVQNRSEHLYRLFTARLADGAEVPLSQTTWLGSYPRPDLAWLPDGSGLMVTAVDARTGRRQVQRIGYPSGEVTNVTNDLASYSGVSISRRDSALVTIKDDTAPQIWVSPPGRTGEARQVTTGSPGYEHVSWTSDGQLLASGQGIWMVDPATGRKQRIPGSEDTDGQAVAIPSTRDFVFQSRRSKELALWRGSTSGGAARQLTRGDQGGSPRVSNDGRWVVYGGFGEDQIAVWRVAVDGGAPVRVSHGPPAWGPDVSPDGQWISAVSDNRQLLVLPFAGGAPVKVMQARQRYETPAWMPDGTGVSYAVTSSGVSNLWRQAVPGGGDPQRMTNFTAQQILHHAWSRDGRLAVVRAARMADVVVMRGVR